jgi:hypothetical protein
LCLGFEISSRFLKPVSYIENLLQLDLRQINSGDQANAIMDKILWSKYVHWKYEDEVRLWVGLSESEGGLYFKPFDADIQLVEILGGVRFDDTLNDEERKVLSSCGVDIFRTRLSECDFKIERSEKLRP